MIDKKKVQEIIDDFKNKSVLVIGDIMLDKYIWGSVSRISPEAPVQIVQVNNESFAPGGSTNVANNVSALGAKSTVVGLVGNDEAGKTLLEELRRRKINTKGIMIDPNRPTTTKIRVMAQNQQLIRVDYEKSHSSEDEIYERVIEFIRSTIKLYDIILVPDYEKGLLTKELMDTLKELCKKHEKKIIVDPKPKNMAVYDNVFIITPNHIEASGFAGIEEENDHNHIKEIGEKIQEKLNTNVLITRGNKGMSLFEKGKELINIPTKAKEVYDVTGAGDTVVAALTMAIACGATLEESAHIANHAAGIVVGKLGTATATAEELKMDFEDYE